MKKFSIVLGLFVFFTSNLYALQPTTNKTITQETINVSNIDHKNYSEEREDLHQGRKESLNHDALQPTTNKTITQETINVSNIDHKNYSEEHEDLHQGRKESFNHDNELNGNKITDVDYDKFLNQHNNFDKESDNTLHKDQA